MDRNKIHFWLTWALAFLMPVYQKFVPIVLILMVLNWLSLGKGAFRFQNRPKYIALLPLLAYFLWHICGMMWSSNLTFGAFDLQIKLPFLLLPLIYLAFDFFNRRQFEKVLWAFIWGCLTAVFIGFVNSIYVYVTGKSPILDFYQLNISPVLHIGYFAMYLNTALVLVIYMLLKSEKHLYSLKNAMLILLSLIFAMATFLSTARNGFLVLIMIVLLLAIYGIVRYRKWMLAFMTLLIIWIAASTLLKDIGLRKSSLHGFDYVVQLAEEKGEVNNEAWESTAVRVLLWKSAWELIADNPVLGTGTGDIKDELMKIYKRENYIHIIDKQLNVHNQFLQSWSALGILGLFLSILCFVLPLYLAIKSRNFVLGLFILNVGASCLSESVLEVQAGVVFFAFFITLFVLGDKNKAFIDLHHVQK